MGIELAEQPYAASAKQQRQWEQKVTALEAWQAPVTAMLLPALTRASQAAAGGEAGRDLARIDLARTVEMPRVELVPDAPQGTRVLSIDATQGTHTITLQSEGAVGGRIRFRPRSPEGKLYGRALADTTQENNPASEQREFGTKVAALGQ